MLFVCGRTIGKIMVFACLETLCTSNEIGRVVHRPGIAVVVTLDLRRQVIVNNGVLERPTGFSICLLVNFYSTVDDVSYEVKQGVFMVLLLSGIPNKQYEVA